MNKSTSGSANYALATNNLNGRNQKALTDDEKAMAEYCLEFIKCKSALQFYMREKVSTNECSFRQELYSLLDLGERFKDVFGDDDFVRFTMD